MTTPLEEQDIRTIYNAEDRSRVLYKEFVLHCFLTLPCKGRVASASERGGVSSKLKGDPTRLRAARGATLPFQGRDEERPG